MSSSGNVKCPVSPGDVIAGKYRVEHVLGAGGMGVVVAATHTELDQPVALKFILPHALSGKGNVERFMREARAVVRLKSEHVARVYDVGRHDDQPFMVLELLEGMDLAKLNKQKGPLPVADSVEYLLQACEALVEAHAAGIVHRDLKPQNLFVTRRLNGTPLVKVLDFGIAKAVGPGAVGQMALTDSAAIIGSPLYMAPEAMRSARTAELRSDIWGLGVMLFELLGGQLPFDGETMTEVCIRVVNEDPPDLLALRPGLDPALVAIVKKCLEKDPDARFHNVSALAAALEPFSRSAKQGGPVRPWRSFEDTQDSANGAPSPFANVADATGPATLVTMEETLPPLEPSEEERRARANAGSTKASAPSPIGRGAGSGGSLADSGAKVVSEKAPLVSTGSAWAESTAASTASGAGRQRRSFSTGVVVAFVAVAAVAAAAGGLYLGRGAGATPPAVAAAAAPPAPAPAPSPSGAPGTAATTGMTGAPVEPAAPPTSSPAPASSDSSRTPATSASVAGRLLSAAKVRGAGARPASATGATPVTPTTPASTASTASTAKASEPAKADAPPAANGAPILH